MTMDRRPAGMTVGATKSYVLGEKTVTALRIDDYQEWTNGGYVTTIRWLIPAWKEMTSLIDICDLENGDPVADDDDQFGGTYIIFSSEDDVDGWFQLRNWSPVFRNREEANDVTFGI